jgi:hypothetical protein
MVLVELKNTKCLFFKTFLKNFLTKRLTHFCFQLTIFVLHLIHFEKTILCPLPKKENDSFKKTEQEDDG